MLIPKSQVWLVLALVGAAVLGAIAGRINDYFLDVALGVAINVVLAVSLNLINGFTGQFSLGHAGFMALGAYASALITTTFAPHLLPLVGGQTALLFPLALVAGGRCARGCADARLDVASARPQPGWASCRSAAPVFAFKLAGPGADAAARAAT